MQTKFGLTLRPSPKLYRRYCETSFVKETGLENSRRVRITNSSSFVWEFCSKRDLVSAKLEKFILVTRRTASTVLSDKVRVVSTKRHSREIWLREIFLLASLLTRLCVSKAWQTTRPGLAQRRVELWPPASCHLVWVMKFHVRIHVIIAISSGSAHAG